MVSAFAARLVHAEGDPLELEWDAPKGCPTHDDVIAEVRRIVGTGEVRRRVHAVATVSNEGVRWSLKLETEQGGAGGERTLDGHSCKAVASAAALVLALTLQTDPAPVPSVTPSASSSVPPPPPTTSSAPPILPPPTPKPSIMPVLRAGGGAALSGVPGVSPMANAEIGVRYGRFEGAAVFTFVSETSQASQRDPDTGGAFAQVALGGIACIAPVVGTEKPGIEVWGCAGAEVDWMIARRYGPKDPTDMTPDEATYAYFAPILSPRVTFAPFRRLAFILNSTFSFPVENQAFTLKCRPNAVDCPTGFDRIFRVPPAGVRVGLLVELRF